MQANLKTLLEQYPWLEQVHWLDVTLLALLALAALIGSWRGVFHQALRLTKYVVGVYTSIYCHDPVQRLLTAFLTEVTPAIPDILAYLYVFLAMNLLFFIVGRKVRSVLHRQGVPLTDREVRDLVKTVGLRPLDRLLGAGVGAVTAALVLGGCLLGAGQLKSSEVEARLAGARLRYPVVRLTESALAAIPAQSVEEFKNALAQLEALATRWAGELLGEGLHNATQQATGLLEKAPSPAARDQQDRGPDSGKGGEALAALGQMDPTAFEPSGPQGRREVRAEETK